MRYHVETGPEPDQKRRQKADFQQIVCVSGQLHAPVALPAWAFPAQPDETSEAEPNGSANAQIDDHATFGPQSAPVSPQFLAAAPLLTANFTQP
jgi:hypothetical protein